MLVGTGGWIYMAERRMIEHFCGTLPLGEADFYWQYPLDGRLIERQKPVVVINEMLERFFNVTDPKRLFAQDVLP